jgi:arylsulfatase A-like enzyme
VRRDLLNNYDRELVHLDRELGRLFAYLESSGLAATTTVVFTSDHGEYFGEHDLVFHSKALHAPVVRVPLMIRGPDVPAGRSAKPVQGIDLFPTILEQLGLEPAPGPARSVFADEASEVVAEWYYSESGLLLEKVPGRFERDLCSYRLGPLRAILSSRSDAESELYDLSNDPLERRDLSAGRGADLAVIRARVEAWLEAHPPAEQIRLDRSTLNEAERRAAAELGYAVEDE